VIANSSTSCSDTNAAHAVAFAANDSLDLLVVGASAPTNAVLSWVANFG